MKGGRIHRIDEKGDHSVFYGLNSGYYHVGLHPLTRRFVGIKWDGVYYVYTCLPFGLLTAPWVFFKFMREMEVYWRRRNIPCLDEFFFPKKGFRACGLVGIQLKGAASKQVSKQISPREV